MSRKFVPLACGGFVLVTSSIVMLSWILGYHRATYLLPGAASMKFNTAVGFLFLGFAVLASSFNAKKLAALLSTPSFLIGAITLFQYFINKEFNIDNLLGLDTTSDQYPGRPSPITSLNFVFCSTAFFHDIPSGPPKKSFIWQVQLILVFYAATRSLLSYLLGLEMKFGTALHTQMSLPTSFCFLLVSIAIIGFGRQEGFIPLIFGRDHIGKLIRGFLMVIVVGIPLLQFFLLYYGERPGLLNPDLAYTLVNVLEIGILFYVFFRYSSEVAQQIHQRQIVETELLREKEQREKFVYTLNHDLKTPLSAAKLAIQMYARNVEEGKEKNRLLSVLSHMHRMEGMVNDLLDISSIQRGGVIPLDKTRCALNEIVKKSLEGLRTIHGDRFLLREEEDLIGDWDCQSLQRVVENLCNNAVKYGSPSTDVEIMLSRDRDMAVLEVKNRGNPIKAEDLSKLFNLFQQGKSTPSSPGKGWGIGLALVREIVSAHEGEVEVSSSLEDGTDFKVLLPGIISDRKSRLASGI